VSLTPPERFVALRRCFYGGLFDERFVIRYSSSRVPDMSQRAQIRWSSVYGVAALLAVVGASSPCACAQRSTSRSKSILQQRYAAAQAFQSKGNLADAAKQYQIFLADALGELAMGRAQAGQFDKAADEFDEALKLVPDFPMMELEYARAALRAGRPQRAEFLAKDLLKRYQGNAKVQDEANSVAGRALLMLSKSAEAKPYLEAAVAGDATFENGYELAVDDLNLGDVEGARKIFAEMLRSFGDTASVHMDFGLAYSNSDSQEDAIKELQTAITEDPNLPGAHYALAYTYLSTAGNTRVAEAEAELRDEIAISNQDAQSYAALGHLLATHAQDSADKIEAEKDLKHAVELAPANPDAYLYLGELYSEDGKTDAAEAALRRSIALTTDASRNGYQVQKAHYLLGRMLQKSGDKVAAGEEFASAHTLEQEKLALGQDRMSDYLGEDHSSNSSADISRAVRVTDELRSADQKTSGSVDAFEKQIAPAIADSYNNLGAIAGSATNYSAALSYFERAAEWQPGLPGLDANWGRAAFEAAAYDQAVPPLSRCLQAHPEDNAVRRELGLSQFVLHRYAQARLTLQPLDGLPTEPSDVQYAYADSLLKLGETPAAIGRLSAIAKASPQVAAVHVALAEAYGPTDYQAASRELGIVIGLDPSDAEAREKLGRLELAHGEWKKAVSDLKAAAKLLPGDEGVRQVLAEAVQKESQAR
jgi:tetratricopeptide (TPR) repeat protein